MNNFIFHWLSLVICFIFTVSPCFAAFEGLNPLSEEIVFDSRYFNQSSNKFEVTLSRKWMYGLSELAVNRFYLDYFGELIPVRTEWRSTGDEIYRENRIMVGAGLKYRRCILEIKGNIYNLFIKNYGSNNTFGADFFFCCEPIDKYFFSVGSEGLITGVTEQTNNLISRKVWGKVNYQISKLSEMSILVETFKRGEPFYSLGYHQELNRMCGFELFFSDNPQRFGANILLVFPFLSIKSGFSHQARLGWCQRLEVSYSW